MTVQKAIDLQRGKAGAERARDRRRWRVQDRRRTAPPAPKAQSDTQRYVFRVTQMTDPALDSNAVTVQQVKNLLQNSYSDDLVGEYLARLESDFEVSINQSALNQVVGGTTEQ